MNRYSVFLAPAQTLIAVVVLVVATAGLPLNATAQPSTENNIFLRFVGEHADELESAAIRFQRPVTRAIGIEYSGSAEMDAFWSECATLQGASVEEQRRCDLQAARRLLVEEVVVFDMTSPNRGSFELTMEVWSPEANRLVFPDYVDVEADSASAAVRSGLPILAQSYLCYRQVESACEEMVAGGGTDPAPTEPYREPEDYAGVIEVVRVSPSPAELLIDGRSAGMAPGQFDVEPGSHDVTLRATGYIDWTDSVRVSAGSVEVLSNIELEPEPALLTVECNVTGAAIVVDGIEVGTTRRNRGVELSLPPSARILEVRRDAYITFETSLSLTPGGRRDLEVTLEAQPTMATLVVEANVSDATIFVDGAEMGTTRRNREVSIEVEPGSSRVLVSRDGYVDNEQRLVLTAGERTSIEVTLAEQVDPRARPEGFVFIEAGTFQRGSPSSESGRFDNETQHRVTLTRDFYMQAHEVTQGEWRDLMGNNPSHFSSCGTSCPVEMVNWYEAVAYANALSREEGLEECYSLSGCSNSAGEDMECSMVRFDGLDCEGYRLPTEAEWEYAARAGTTTAWYCGSRESCIDGIAWYSENAESETHRVGSKRANDWGLYDMSGNVWEWVWDWHGEYPNRSATDPTGPGSGAFRVQRGGCWYSDARRVRSAHRRGRAPGLRFRSVGFRLSRSAP